VPGAMYKSPRKAIQASPDAGIGCAFRSDGDRNGASGNSPSPSDLCAAFASPKPDHKRLTPMVKAKRRSPKQAFPFCICEAFKACPKHPSNGNDESGTSIRIGVREVATTGPLWRHRPLLTFLAGKDDRHEVAEQVWCVLREVVVQEESALRNEDAFEVAAGSLLIDALRFAPNSGLCYGRHTRNELRDLDTAVLKATEALLDALGKHQELLPVPSTRFWPTKARKRLRDKLYGLPVGSLSGLLFLAEPMPDQDSPDALAWWVENNGPSIGQVLLGLRDATYKLRASRSATAKVSQKDVTHQPRELLRGLLERHPKTSSEDLARIVAPIIETYTGKDHNDAVARAARRMRTTR
jgi:hypothetical protein